MQMKGVFTMTAIDYLDLQLRGPSCPGLSPVAQRDEYARRKLKRLNPLPYIGFQIDKEMILHSEHFRKLIHKRQIFMDNTDYRETRLIHTLEVINLARRIGRMLGANEDLLEAISMGHDIGRTSFGHVGEKVLNDILRKKETLNGRIMVSVGGFQHNFQSVRLADRTGGSGLNLSWQVREGIFKHTRIRKPEDMVFDGENNKPLLCDYPDFDLEGLFPEYDYSVTIEGQIVAVADMLIQKAHSVDDCIRSGLLKQQQLEQLGFKMVNGDHDQQAIVWGIVSFFVEGLADNTYDNLTRYWSDYKNRELFNHKNIIIKKLVEPSAYFKGKFDELDALIASVKGNNYSVKAIFLIKSVFKAYLLNQRRLPEEVLFNVYGNLPFTDEQVRAKHGELLRVLADYIAGMSDKELNDAYKKLYMLE